MRARTATGGLTLALAVALVVGVVPARSASISGASSRWASAFTFDGPRLALIGFNDVRAGVGGPGQYACVGLVNHTTSRYAVACTDREFASLVDPGAARAVGSMRATVWRYPDTVAVGTTTLHYDVRWNATTAPAPYNYGAAGACAGIPWASAGAGVHLASLAAVEGTVSSATLGTARFDPAARAWYTAVGESAGVSASTGTPLAPLHRTVQCVSRTTTADLQRLTSSLR